METYYSKDHDKIPTPTKVVIGLVILLIIYLIYLNEQS